jgi:TfoX/Sxy family transcriptional regulator of competence genes
MPLNIEPQDDGSIIVDDESDGGVNQRVCVSVTQYGEIKIEDMFQGVEITIATHIAEGLTAAILDLLRANQISREIL